MTTPTGEVAVRRAKPADADTMLALIVALAHYEKLDPPDQAARERLVRDAFCECPRFEVYLAEVKGKAIGYAFVFETYSTFLARPTLYIEDIFVLPEHRKAKAGLTLFRKCVEIATERECGRIEWVTLDWNVSAQEFFKRFGARQMKEWFPFRLTRDQFGTILTGKR
jgi:GNAT superfamily N-acetyltransferase